MLSYINRSIITTYSLFIELYATITQSDRPSTDKDSGEGVVSAAIAVLIFAFLGVILWVAFKATMGTATNTVNAQVAQLGQ